MQLYCFSVSHQNTPVELRECLSLPAETLVEGYTRYPIRCGTYAGIEEMVILSTCNRLEVYAILNTQGNSEEPAAFQPLLSYLEEAFYLPLPLVQPYLRQFAGSQVVEHLFQVSAGLDSIAIGETQILGQVSHALDTALQMGSARHVLSSLFRAAIHTGKQVRTDTEIGRRPTSISSLAVELAEDVVGNLSQRNVLVVGAGKMGSYAVEALQEHGVKDIFLINRTYSHAAEIVTRLGGTALPYDHLFDGLLSADVVFTSTAAPLPIIRPDLVSAVMTQRAQRPLMLIDLAVPRNVDPRAREVSNVQVYDMDGLQTFAVRSPASSHQEISRAQAIVQKELEEYEKLLHIIPFIGELHKKVENIRQREVDRALRHLPDPDPQVLQQIDLFSRSLVRKILHEPTMHLRKEMDQENIQDYVTVLSRLFDLQSDGMDLLGEDQEKWIQ